MSDHDDTSQQTRQITGLTPRTGEPNVTALRRGTRTRRPAGDVDDSADPAVGETSSSPTPERGATRRSDARGPGAAPADAGTAGRDGQVSGPLRAVPGVPSEPAASPKAAVTFYIDRQLRNRARAAYRATAHLHGEASWSAFVERAVDELTQRRELEHNDSHPYAPDPRALSPGRPISDDN